MLEEITLGCRHEYLVCLLIFVDPGNNADIRIKVLGQGDLGLGRTYNLSGELKSVKKNRTPRD